MEGAKASILLLKGFENPAWTDKPGTRESGRYLKPVFIAS
jgi:hypothetical protein